MELAKLKLAIVNRAVDFDVLQIFGFQSFGFVFFVMLFRHHLSGQALSRFVCPKKGKRFGTYGLYYKITTSYWPM